jgi:hypothetical protein
MTSRTAPAPVWIVVGSATVVMAAALGWGAVSGELAVEGSALLRMPWGLVSLVEIYVGITLFACWIFWREANSVRAGAWTVAVVLIGNLVSCVYVLLALRAARGDALRFWMGARAPDAGAGT